MIFDIREYLDAGIDPEALFRTTLPGSDYLRDTVLDPGLSTDVGGLAGQALQKLIQKRSLIDALHLQQFAFFDVGRHAGIFENYKPVVRDMLQTVSVAVESNDYGVLGRELAQTAIGAVGNALTQSGNPYAMIAGAVLGFANMLWNLFESGPQSLPTGSLPLQEFSESTDEDQFNTMVRASLQTRNWNPLFMPRFRGEHTIQYREDSIGRQAFAFGLGSGGIGQDTSFTPTGGLGFMPGANRITSIIQSVMNEPPRDKAPFYSTRKGDCAARLATIGQDVGTYYPSTNQGVFLVWDSVMKVSPGMFCINTQSLGRAWSDYYQEWETGIRRWWSRRDMFDLWGIGAWKCALNDLLQRLTVGPRGVIGPGLGGGMIGTGTFINWDKYRETSVFASIILPALGDLTRRQLWYLENTTAAAYVPPGAEFYKYPRGDTMVEENRRRILATSSHEVRTADVLDLEYRSAIKEAKINRLRQPGEWVDTGDGVAAPPRATPPKAQPPKGGNPWGDYVPASAAPFVALGLGGVAVWLLSQRRAHA
jgi:hypothetical protein